MSNRNVLTLSCTIPPPAFDEKLHDDGVALLQEIVKNKTLKAKGVVGIFPACSVGDDIDVYDATGSTKKGTQKGTPKGFMYTLVAK